jgi:ubiquinol-cytochrome c reductase cytochrome b subunit
VFFAPTMGGYFLEHDNFEPANTLQTPPDVAPVWYFTPFYAILRAMPDKLLGVILMGASVLLPLFLPWLDRCRVKSIRYRSWTFKVALAVFAVSFVVLGYIAMQPVTPLYVLIARVFTVTYLAFFVLMPFYTRNEKTKPVPTRVTK